MEGFCRGCLIKYDEPMELLQYTEKNRRLFVYSTGLQVKRNDSFTFQLCKDCYLNMKQACKFKKNCRTSDKRFRNYIALKDVGDPVDFCTFLKNSDDTLTFRLPMASGNSTPANQKSRDDDNESTCTSIRNFMTDILQGEEMPDTEARIIKEVIEEEADVLDDSLDSHWLQDDMSIDTDFRLDFSFSQFSTPRTVNDDRCYTPKQKEDQITFETINTEKQTKILNDFTNAFKTDDNIEELSIFVGSSSIEKTGCFENLKEFSPLGIDEIDGMEKSGVGIPKSNENLKENLNNFDIDEMESMETLDNKTGATEQNMRELCDFERQREVFGGQDEIHGNKVRAVKMNKSLKELISNLDIEEIGKSDSKDAKTNQILKELVGNLGKNAIDVFEKPDSDGPRNNINLKELCDFSLDSFSGGEKVESKALKNVKSLKELCDFSLDSFEDTVKSGSNTFKNNQNVKELCDLSLNDFEDIANSVSLKNNRKIKESCNFGIPEIDKSERNLDLPSLPDVIEEYKIDTPDFDIPKCLIGSIQSNDDISKSSINIEALLKDKSCSIDKNLEEALKNSDNKEFSLEDLLVSPPVFPAASAASTPTITNILFGENMDTTDTNTKIEQCLEAYHDVQTDIEIFEEFFKNDTKEFDLDDFNREYKSGDWKKPDADTDFKVADKENDLENIKMDIPVEGRDLSGINNDKVIKKSVRKSKKTKSMIHIPHDDINDKFNIDYLYCKLCKIRYDTSRAFSVHLSKKHNIKVVKPRKPNRKKSKHEVIKTKMEATINISDTPATDKFDFENSYCKLCDIKYDTNRALSIHFAKTHHIKIEKPKSVKKERSHELLCNNCGDKSKDRPSFARHMKKCGKKAMTFTCDRCKLDFATQPHLDKHMTCHTKMKKKKETGKEFVCTICGTIIHRQYNFILHMRRHTKDYSARCDYCDKGFYRQSDLKAHMRGHTGDTHFSCKFCPKLFTRKDVLLRHILIHLDERLYVCDYCSKRFIKKYDLMKHIQNYSCRKLLKNERKAVKNEMSVDIQKNQEERVEIRKEAKQEVINDVTVIYTKGSHDTIMKQLPFLETERSN